MRKVGEANFYTREEVQAHLEAAQEIVQEVVGELHDDPALVISVFDKLCQKQVQFEQVNFAPPLLGATKRGDS